MIRKILLCGALAVVCLYGADFWTRPYADWSAKEIQKMGENSPWAKTYEVLLGDGGGGGGGGRGRGGGRGGGGGDMSKEGGYGDSGEGGGAGGNSVTLYIRWQSALPVKQATVLGRFGAETATSPDAQRILGANEPDYVIVIDGLNRRMVGGAGGDAEALKKKMMDETTLVVKGKEPIKPTDFRIVGKGRMSAVFAFPKTNPITLDDKEVEFDSKIGSLNIKQKFRLKDMMYMGKLEL